MHRDGLRLMAAPLQGLTEAPWRLAHSRLFPDCKVTYFSPFIRIEKGSVRPRDMRDISPRLNASYDLIPQVIVRDAGELAMLADAVAAEGYDRIDINMGCPFVPQVKKGRGAGLLTDPARLTGIAEYVRQCADIRFSIKMRLGVNRPDEWESVAPVINSMPLNHVTVHPRTAVQQYKGEIYHAEFSKLLSVIGHPVIYNGDITSPEGINDILAAYPALAGIMAGRGLLARPSMFAEWRTGKEWAAKDRNEAILKLHETIFSHYSSSLCGDHQILAKLKPMWEYIGTNFDRKAVKIINKATTLTDYITRVRSIVI